MTRKRSAALLLGTLVLVVACAGSASAAAWVRGYVLDPNWYAPHRVGPPPPDPELPDMNLTGYDGWGLYEYGVSGNINNDSTSVGFFDDTAMYGVFSKTSQPDGTYTFATWDVWWRSQFVFNKSVIGPFAQNFPMRLHANMFTYAINWGPHVFEYGQTFRASGKAVTMACVLAPDSSIKWTASIHEDGPNGPQIGPSRTMNSGGDLRFKWNGSDTPTVPGRIYYLKFRAYNQSTSQPTTGALGVHDPIPDMSDPMPDGCLWLDGVPQWGTKDLAATICSDDDGLITDMYIHKAETWQSVASAGQTFVARGVNLVGFAAWIPDAYGTYVARLYSSVGGAPVGPAKKNRVMRGADPQILWTWSPGECPLTPGNTYYIEVTKDGGSNFAVIADRWNQYSGGQAYSGRAAQSGWDLCGTITEEESAGSATRETVKFGTYPGVAVADRAAHSLTVRWTTDVPSDSIVEYAAWECPYSHVYYNTALTTNHVVALTGLEANTPYHIRVTSTASGRNSGISRDFLACTINDTPNLLVNPSFEEGCAQGFCQGVYPGWTCGGMDFATSDGTFYWAVPPYAGGRLLEGAMNGSDCNAYVYQRVPATPGVEYSFTCAISSWMRENGTFKYDEWEQPGRLDYLKIGIDPTGGTNPISSSIQWTDRFYSHLSYTSVGKRTTATADHITVFVSMQGRGGQWHCYGLDDCRLTVNYAPCGLADLLANRPDGTNAEVGSLIVSATPAEAGAYYAETADRSSGIRVVSADTVAPGMRVTVRGTLNTDRNTGERSLVNAKLLNAASDAEPEPLLMLCRSVGGEAIAGSPEVSGSIGPRNTGLAVRLAGRITARDPGGSWVCINDGSLDGDGIRVDTSRISPALVPGKNVVAGISGISSLRDSDGVKPLLIVRRASDIQIASTP